MFKTLQQGETFKKIQNKYHQLIDLSNLARISRGRLNIVNNLKYGSPAPIIEGIDGEENEQKDADVSPIEKLNLAEMQKLKNMEMEFNTKMLEYKDKYQKYLTQLTKRQTVGSKHRNKVVTYDKSNFYVNNSGMARAFSNAAWNARDKTCPGSSGTLSSTEFSRLPRGTPMGIGEICRGGGWNAMDSGSGTTAWVDNQGYKHIYTDFRNRNKSCPADSTKITSIQFNAIPKGANYTNANTCDVMSLDSPLYTQLVAINSRLMGLAQEMLTEVQKLAVKDQTLDKAVKDEKKKLMDLLTLLKIQKAKVKKMQTKVITFKAEAAEQNLDASSIQMHHFIWGILLLTFGTTIFKLALDS